MLGTGGSGARLARTKCPLFGRVSTRPRPSSTRYVDSTVATLTPRFVHANRRDDAALMATVRRMADETGAEAFVRQQKALATQPRLRELQLLEAGGAKIVDHRPRIGR